MKKANIAAMALASLALLATSCSSEDALDTSVATGQMTFKATQETPGVTSRTALASDGLTINWVTENEVGIYDDKMESATSPAKYSVTADGTDATKATLTGSSTKESTAFVAVYPKDNCTAAKYSTTEITGVTFKATQTATENTFDPAAAVMVATATTTDPVFSFKNVCAFLKFKAAKAYSSVKVTSTQSISGTFTVNPTDYSVSATSSADGDKIVTLSGPIEQDKTYYICVAPFTGGGDFKIECSTSSSEVDTYTSSKTTTLARNNVYDLGTLGYSVDPTTATIYVGNVQNVQKLTFANVKNATEFTVANNSSNVGFYSDAACSNAISINNNKGNTNADGTVYVKALAATSTGVTVTIGGATSTITVAKPTLSVDNSTIAAGNTTTITHKTNAAVDGGDATLVQKSTDSGSNYSAATENTDYTITNNGGGTYTFKGITEGMYKVTINGQDVTITVSAS